MLKVAGIIVFVIVVGLVLITIFWNWDHVREAIGAFVRSLPKVMTYRSGHGRHSLLNHQAGRE